MNRRGFLGTILALGIAPAVARASSLMPVRVLDAPRIIIPGDPLFTGELGRYEGVRFIESDLKWSGQHFDFGNQYGLMVELPDGRRHAVRTYGWGGKRPYPTPDTRDVLAMKQKLLAWANQSPRVPRGIL